MNPLKLIHLLFIGLVLTACGQTQKTEPAPESSTAVQNAPQNTPKKGCLIDYRDKTCDLVSPDQIAEIIGVPSSDIKVRDNSNVLQSSPELIACLFETPGSTKQGTVTVGQLQTDDSGTFKTKYNNEYYSQKGRKATYLDDPIGDGSVFVQIPNNATLVVLIGNELFSVQLYGNNRSDEENLKIAKRVAQLVLQNCK